MYMCLINMVNGSHIVNNINDKTYIKFNIDAQIEHIKIGKQIHGRLCIYEYIYKKIQNFLHFKIQFFLQNNKKFRIVMAYDSS